jgi:hypothetical protein
VTCIEDFRCVDLVRTVLLQWFVNGLEYWVQILLNGSHAEPCSLIQYLWIIVALLMVLFGSLLLSGRAHVVTTDV